MTSSSLEPPCRAEAMLRTSLLASTGALFLVIALAMLIAPTIGAELLGLRIDAISASSELRSGHGGMHLAFGLFLLVAALGERHQRAALLLVTLVSGGYGFGRIVSLVIDGSPGPLVWSAFALEVVGAVTAAVLLVRLEAGARIEGAR